MSPALPKDFAPEVLADALRGASLGATREVVAVAASTMDLAWAARDRGAAHGHLVLADAQTAGRGSYGRRWTSPGGEDLYLSVLLRPQMSALDATAFGIVPLAVGLAVCDLARSAGLPACVKWPNDVVVARPGRLAKLAGVLVEARAPAGTRAPDLVVGIGLNVGRATFPPFEGAHLPGTSLALEGSPRSRPEVLRTLLDGLARQLARLGQEGAEVIARDVEAWLWGCSERVQLTVEGQDPAVCELLGVAPDGALRVRRDGTVHALRSGRLAALGQYQ